MHFFRTVFRFSALFFTVLAPVYGAESGEPMRITVSNLTTVNGDKTYGLIISSMLSAALHASGSFIIIDNEQKERSDSGRTQTADETAESRDGSYTIDKTIVGSIAKNGQLVITVMSVDVKTAEIDTVITEKADENADLKEIIGGIAEKIRRFYLVRNTLNRKTDICVKAVSFFPVGAYAEYLHPSYGVAAAIERNGMIFDESSLFLLSGVNFFPVKQDRYREFMQMYAAAGIGGRFVLFNGIIISPKGGIGPVLTKMNYDSDGKRNAAGFKYETKYFRNLGALAEIEASFHMKNGWMIGTSGGFMRIFDRSKSGSLLFAGAGIKRMF
jgi:hypothetical protein